MDSFYFISIKSIRDCQNFDINSLSRSDIIVFSIPYCIIIVLKSTYTRSSAVDASLYSIKYLYFIVLSLITSMLSYSTFVSGSSNGKSLTIKLSIIVSHALSRVDSDCSRPYGLCRNDLDFAQVSHSLMYFSISFRSFSQTKSRVISSIVLLISGWPTIFSSCLLFITSYFYMSDS